MFFRLHSWVLWVFFVTDGFLRVLQFPPTSKNLSVCVVWSPFIAYRFGESMFILLYNRQLSYPRCIIAFLHSFVPGIGSCSRLHFTNYQINISYIILLLVLCAFINALNHLAALSFCTVIIVPNIHTCFLKYPLELRMMSYLAFFKSVRRQRESQQNQNIFL